METVGRTSWQWGRVRWISLTNESLIECSLVLTWWCLCSHNLSQKFHKSLQMRHMSPHSSVRGSNKRQWLVSRALFLALSVLAFKHLHNIQCRRDWTDWRRPDWVPWWSLTVGHCWQTLFVSDVVCSVCVMRMSCDRGDPDASFQPPCRRGEGAQTDSHNRESLSIALDNESNVLTSRNPHIEANTE
jgi:hypothetical protein